ncbi:MotA/TolQ/ExbB proton channel family protein [bacterium SCSIO 12643]|nr:MotA/TolQ/ExbB proton channel family protein [bacterium SCSIO 12643]
MRKFLAVLAVAGVLTFGVTNVVNAQEDSTTEVMADDTANAAAVEEEVVEEPAEEPAAAAEVEEAPEVEKTFHQAVKQKFIEGDAGFMSFVALALILGLAIVIERIIYLSMSSSNTSKLVNDVETALNTGGIDAAKDICRNTAGPVASIFYQGLDRYDEGIEMVEKSVIAYGGVQVGQLEKNVSWISLFIALAPMLGFFGTVIGMISAFDAIAEANNISPGIVAVGIGQALITTVSGLLVAMVLQVFYNYIVSKIDSITNDMEDASISLIDILVKYQHNNK